MTWKVDENGDVEASVLPRLSTDSVSGTQVRRQAVELFELTGYHNLTQVVNVKTRDEEILDLMFVNNSDMIYSVNRGQLVITT